MRSWGVSRRRGLRASLPRWLCVLELAFLVPAAAACAAMAPACWPEGGAFPLFPLAPAGLEPWRPGWARRALAAVRSCWAARGAAAGSGAGRGGTGAGKRSGAGDLEGRRAGLGRDRAGAECAAAACSAREGRCALGRAWGVHAVPLAATAGTERGLLILTAAQEVRISGSLGRFEALVSAALTAGLCLTLGLLGCLAGEFLGGLGVPKRLGGWIMVPAAGILFGIEGLPAWALLAGASIFWGAAPLAALWIGQRGETPKSRRKRKSS